MSSRNLAELMLELKKQDVMRRSDRPGGLVFDNEIPAQQLMHTQHNFGSRRGPKVAGNLGEASKAIWGNQRCEESRVRRKGRVNLGAE